MLSFVPGSLMQVRVVEDTGGGGDKYCKWVVSPKPQGNIAYTCPYMGTCVRVCVRACVSV